MQTALITGTSGGIGLATAKALNLRGINVVGLSRSSSGYTSPIFREITIDITDTSALALCVRQLCKEYDFDILINNAGAAYYGLHENLSAAMIHEIVSVNLEAPMIICSLMINRLKKNRGTIINISSTYQVPRQRNLPTPMVQLMLPAKQALHLSPKVFLQKSANTVSAW